MKKLFSTNNDIAYLIARLALGIMIFPHGCQLLLGWFGGGGFDKTVTAMSQGGIPVPFVYLAIIAEFFGGLGLILGFLSRISAFGVGTVMVVAVLHVHLKNGFFMPTGYEFHILATALALIVMIRGAGPLSIDSVLSRKRAK